MYRVTSDGVRVHDSVRQHGGPETARRVLVVGLETERGDLFHLDAKSALELRAILDEFLRLPNVGAVLGGGARQTDGDREAYGRPGIPKGTLVSISGVGHDLRGASRAIPARTIEDEARDRERNRNAAIERQLRDHGLLPEPGRR